MEFRRPSLPQVIQALGNSKKMYLFASSQAHRVPQYLSLDLLDRRVLGRCLEREVARGHHGCLATTKHHPASPGQASRMGRGPDHDHTVLARSDLVPREHVPSNTTMRKVQTITVAPLKCRNQGSNSKGHEKHPNDCLEAHIAICALSGIIEKNYQEGH